MRAAEELGAGCSKGQIAHAKARDGMLSLQVLPGPNPVYVSALDSTD